MNKRNLTAVLAAVLLLPAFALANGFSLNGLGSRAQSMGGAYAGIADDFSAWFWNPAGAAGFRKEMFGFSAVDLMPRTTYRFAPEISIPEVQPIDATTPVAHYLGFLGGYYRPVGDKVVLGFGVGTTSGLGTRWDGADLVHFMGGAAYEWSGLVRRVSFSPMAAVRISEAVSVGIAVNIDYGSFSLKRYAGTSALPEPEPAAAPSGRTTESGMMALAAPVDLGQYDENMNGWGVGATLGIQIRPLETLSLGLTVRTPSTITFDGSASLSALPIYGLPGSSDLERKITWPLWIAGGVAVRPAPRLLLSADVQWTQWSTLDRITTLYLDPVWAALLEMSGNDSQALDWADKTQVRFGAEYGLNASTALRAGYYHDPAPGPLTTLNVLLPTFTYDAFTIGVGKTIGDLQLDFGLECLAGRQRTVESLLDAFQPGTYGMKMVVPSVSVSYKF